MNSKRLSIFISRNYTVVSQFPNSPRNPNYHKTASEITQHPSQTYRKMIPASDGNCSLFTNPFTACTPSSPNPSQIESECFGYPLISTNSVSSSFSEGDSCSNRLNHLLVAENTIPPPLFCLHLVATRNPFCSARSSGANYSEWIFLFFFLIYLLLSFLFLRDSFEEVLGVISGASAASLTEMAH